jgi:hypothetical protein
MISSINIRFDLVNLKSCQRFWGGKVLPHPITKLGFRFLIISDPVPMLSIYLTSKTSKMSSQLHGDNSYSLISRGINGWLSILFLEIVNMKTC